MNERERERERCLSLLCKVKSQAGAPKDSRGPRGGGKGSSHRFHQVIFLQSSLSIEVRGQGTGVSGETKSLKQLLTLGHKIILMPGRSTRPFQLFEWGGIPFQKASNPQPPTPGTEQELHGGCSLLGSLAGRMIFILLSL